VLQSELKRFYAISRLSPLKRTGQIIQAFQELQYPLAELHIYGDGEEETLLKQQAEGCKNIHFHGAIDFKGIHEAHAANDCLIIASTIEAGPYTGVEAMAAGRLIISSRVGAMETRLPDYPFFYDGTVNDLKEKMKQMLDQEASKNQKIAEKLRKRYTENYSEVAIGKSYLDILV
jgi:glycosyltransferase involved in cell wall biosynthesis